MAMVVMLNIFLISLEAMIGIKPAACLRDSGAYHNFLLLNQFKTNGLKFGIKQLFGVHMVDRQEVPSIEKVIWFVNLGPFKTALTIYILDCDASYNIDIPFIQTVNLFIDQVACSVSIYTAEGLYSLKVTFCGKYALVLASHSKIVLCKDF